VSEDASKPVRTLSIRIVSETPNNKNKNIVVIIPNVRKPVPLFILMRALGVLSDKEIIQYCLLDLKKNNNLIDLFIPCVHDAGMIFTQETALKYIATLIKSKTIPHSHQILTDYVLPHIGEMNYLDKAYYIGYMVKELLMVYTKQEQPTDRDSYKYKRVELPGTLLYDLFKEYYSLQQLNIFQKIDKEYYYKQGVYQNNFIDLIELNHKYFFSDRIVETGFNKAFKGNWGSVSHTKKLGVVQPLNRLSYNSSIAHLRKISLHIEASAKIVAPHLLHNSSINKIATPPKNNWVITIKGP
jgi:DNA-directed RNA polymerase II subunit RPB2